MKNSTNLKFQFMTALVIICGPLLFGQSYSFEISDSSLLIQSNNGVINTPVVNINGNNNGAGKISLSGLNPQLELNNIQIAHMGGNELGLDGDIVPYASVTFDLGNNVITEHWDQVVARSFITYSPPLSMIKSVKNKGSVLPQILNLEAVEYTNKRNEVSIGFAMSQLKKYLPEVLSTQDVDYDQATQQYTVSQTEPGINYDAFIPILIKAIQEQQALIDQMHIELVQLNSTPNH